MNKGKCPKCDAVITEVETEFVAVRLPPDKQWKGLSYVCPKCEYVLSVGLDPISLLIDGGLVPGGFRWGNV